MSAVSQSSDGASESPLAAQDGVAAEAAIRALVHQFYKVVQGDPLLGPVFAARIAADRWPAHLAKMCDFWSSVLLRSGRYDGRPLPPHLALTGIGDAHFARWLALFRATAQGVLPPGDAAAAIIHAERMAQSFRLAIAFQRGEDTTRVKPLDSEAPA